jgi:glycosyltransferase involved in cell wall biosynthesis
LVYHGSLLPYYGVDVLLEAIGRVRDRWPFELDVYGGGEAAEALSADARDRDLGGSVRFHGTIPQTGLAAVLQAAGGGVVPTRGGPMLDLSLSNKLLEMACIGMPIVASALPTYRRHLPDDCAIYAAPGDPASLAAALDRFAGMSGTERSALARRAAAAYRAVSWERQREAYLEVVERLATDGRDAGLARWSTRNE